MTDTGPGIAPDIIGRIFDPFFTTKAPGLGTGLGLAICQRIVTGMGGDLTAHSEGGHGTTFRVSLPAAAEVARPTPAVVAENRVARPRGRILVVDDEELIVRAVERVLGSEHDVVSTIVAREALDLCASGHRKAVRARRASRQRAPPVTRALRLRLRPELEPDREDNSKRNREDSDTRLSRRGMRGHSSLANLL